MLTRRNTAFRLAATVLLLAGTQSCGPDGPPYPYGLYPGPCASDRDCYPGSYCIEPGPGTCTVPCRSDFDCGPPPAVCRSNKRRGAKGEISVCALPL